MGKEVEIFSREVVWFCFGMLGLEDIIKGCKVGVSRILRRLKVDSFFFKLVRGGLD